MAEAPVRIDPFRFGWRYRYVRQPKGEVLQEQIPLTPADLLNPQLGDEIPQTTTHQLETSELFGQLCSHFAKRQDTLVVSDLKMLWRIPNLAEPAPDVAVIFGIQDKESDWEYFDCVLEGTRPSLIIEVVDSRDPELRRNDYERKVEIYERVQIPEYLILAPSTQADRHSFWTGYRRGADRKYQPIQPDSQGFLLSETTQLRFGVAEDGKTVQVFDVVTGERLLKRAERWDALQAVEERIAQAQEQASRDIEARKAAEVEIARLRAELQRVRRL